MNQNIVSTAESRGRLPCSTPTTSAEGTGLTPCLEAEKESWGPHFRGLAKDYLKTGWGHCGRGITSLLQFSPLPPLLLCVRNWLFLIELRYFLPAQPLLTLEPIPYHLCSILATVKPFSPVSSPQSQGSCTPHCGPVWDPCVAITLPLTGQMQPLVGSPSCQSPSLPPSSSFLRFPCRVCFT